MKRFVFLPILLCVLLLLTACGTDRPAGNPEPQSEALPSEASSEPTVSSELPASAPDMTEAPAAETETSAAETERPSAENEAPAETETEQHSVSERRESIAFSGRFSGCDGSIYGLIYNDPFPAGDPMPTVIWNEGAYDKLVIVPRYPGSTVSAYETAIDSEGNVEIADTPTYTTTDSEDGCEIGASLLRPEGGPGWYVEITLPDGKSAGMLLNYNGRYGTPVFEFICEPYSSELITVPTAMEDWNVPMEEFGYEAVWDYWRAASRLGLEPWSAADQYFSALTEIGDGAAYTVSAGEMEGDTYTMSAARLHQNYDSFEGSIADRVAAQFALYQQIGNERGILGPSRGDESEALYYKLTGLTVFNPSLTGASVRVSVNGTDCGEFRLVEGDFCTLIRLDLPEVSAEQPLTVTVQVIDANQIPCDEVILEVYPGLQSNISSAL